jgi:hypothetical protein
MYNEYDLSMINQVLELIYALVSHCWRTGGVIQVTELLLSKNEALSSSPSTTKRKKK